MATDSAAAAWGRYREAIADMYGRSVESIILEPPAAPAAVPDDDAIDAALMASTALGEALAGELQSDDSDRCEFAVMRLLAAATVDLSIAHDMAPFDLEADGETDLAEDEWVGPALPHTLGEAAPVLESGPDDIFRRSIITGGAAGPGDMAGNPLHRALNSATQGVLGDASSTATSTVSILLGPVADLLDDTVTTSLEDIFDRLARRLRRVAKFLRKGVDKILAIVGNDLREKVRGWIGDKAVDLGNGLLERSLAHLYGAGEMLVTLGPEIDEAVAVGRSANHKNAAKDLYGLQARFHTQTTWTRRIAWLIRRTRGWLFAAAPPWSGLAVASGSLIATGAVIVIGDDYLDWPRSGRFPRLSLVRGATPIVREAL